MARTGYLFIARNLTTREEDLAWMKRFGCGEIIEEDGDQEKTRPRWRRMLTHLRSGDEVVVSAFSNAVRGMRELGVFLDLCREYKVRIVSIHDGIDTKGELFPETTVGDVLWRIGRLSSETTSVRQSEAKRLSRYGEPKPRTVKQGIRREREKTIVDMYNSGHSIDDIWKISGYKSRTSVFRVLNRRGVKLNRGRHQGPLGKRKKQEQ